MTQAERIREYMHDFGSITPMDTFRDLGITKLATRISEMRANGEIIFGEPVPFENRYGEKRKFMRYWLG